MGDRFDWKFWASLCAAIASLVVPVVLWQLDFSSKALAVQVTTSVAVLSEKSVPALAVEVTVDGVKLDSPYLSTLNIKNSGSRPISTADFEAPIEIAVSEKTKIVRAKIDSVFPDDLRPVLRTDGQIKIEPLLLNPGDSFTISALTSGTAPKFVARARISGIKQIDFQDYSPFKPNYPRATYAAVVAAVVIFAYFFFVTAVFRPLVLPAGRWVGLLAPTALGLNSSNTIARVFIYAGFEPTFWRVIMVYIISGVALLPFLYGMIRRGQARAAEVEVRTRTL